MRSRVRSQRDRSFPADLVRGSIGGGNVFVEAVNYTPVIDRFSSGFSAGGQVQ